MAAQTDYIGYRHWNRIRNNGDAITPHILELIAGLPARAVGPTAPHILGVGSILFFANKQSHVWGSGILNPNMALPGVHESTFYALRGEKTRALLRELKVSLPDVPLGDPGIFAREICDLIPEANRQVRFRAAFVPHHASINHPLYRAIRTSREFVVVDILNDTLLPLEQIAQSEVVVSQSLHGLIYAESLGKPSLWISDRRDEIWRFKFDDWYSTTVEPQREAEPLDAEVDRLIANTRLCGSRIDKSELVRALPAPAVRAQSPPFMGFRSCRKYNPLVFFVDSLFSGRRYVGDEFSPNLIQTLSKKIFPLVYGLFRQWAERSYCLIAPADEQLNLDPEKIATVARYLDENAAVDFAFVVQRDAFNDAVAVDVNGDAGVALLKEHAVAGGAVMLRPDSFQLSGNFATLCV
jgi:hypothetical protein